ncbi:MAG: hypothetical protein PF689_03410 [Deltaproteobacteria bacterium]|jgi:SSS family solute:Na+ symporter|nr:hypothetical protein [Deltaproteobacteria bacterium]
MLFPILAVIFLLLHLVFALGKAKNDEEYFRAKSQASASVIGISLAATILGASGVMGTISWGSVYGITGSLWLLSGVIGLLFLWYLYPRITQRQAFTLLGLCPQSKGNWSKKLFALVIILAWTAIAAAQFKALALLLAPWFNISSVFLLLGLAALISLYLIRGGQKAVFKSDYFQFFIIGMGLLLAFSLLVINGKIQPPDTLKPITADYSPLVFGSVILTYIIGPDIHSRLLAAPDVSTGKNAILIAATIVFVFAIVLALIGLSGALWLGKSGDQIISLMIARSGIWGIFINLALISVLLSSLDTILFTVSSITIVDLIEGDKNLAVWIIPLFALAAAFTAWKGQGIIPVMFSAYNIFSGVAGPPLLFMLFGKRQPDQKMFIISITGSSLVFAVASIYSFHPVAVYPFVFGVLVLLSEHIYFKLRN